MSGLYDIFYPPLGTSVRFKVLPSSVGYEFGLENEEMEIDDFHAKVLTSFVCDFRNKVMPMISEEIEDSHRQTVLDELYKACVGLNPGIDTTQWESLVMTINAYAEDTVAPKPKTPRKTKAATQKQKNDKFASLENHLKDNVIGQDEAVAEIVATMKREFAGLSDNNRPLGVFLLAGPSGCGKTLVAEQLHKHMFDDSIDIVRIDCGEYQHKHENQKLTGSPNGYIGYEEGGQLTNRMISNPESVVLLDEVEKAHPDLWNTFLRVFDDGVLTDGHGRRAMFNKSIIIMTTNLGNAEIARDLMGKGVGFGQAIYKDSFGAKTIARDSVIARSNQAIRDHFKPELLNRIDKVVVFNTLNDSDYAKIADLELAKTADKLSAQNYRLVWADNVTKEIAKKTANPVFGARGIARLRRDKLENDLADLLLDKKHPKGTTFQIVHEDEDFHVTTQKPVRRASNGNTK